MSFAAFALAVLVTAGANASQPDVPLAAFQDYGHPAVDCQNKGPNETDCTIPGKTMGRYAISVQGTSTATGPGATQVIGLGGPGWACGRAATQKAQWTGPRTFVAGCVVTVLSDTPLEVVAAFGGANSKLAASGPVVTIRPLPWTGVLSNGPMEAGIKAQAK
jgi:hypothetical protein